MDARTPSPSARPRSYEAPHALLRRAQLIGWRGDWARTPADAGSADRPQCHFKPIAAGEVVLDSRRSPLARRLNDHYNDAAAIEMEGAGVSIAGHLNQSLPVLIIRGISDRADGAKGTTDRRGTQETAARHAAAFAFALGGDLDG
ncbi:hypothetical protein [Actinoallomurus sp. CA-142502]|uniref:5'-methylthioadenosine/S-adenosylhomocysteine nucleosidase family protein n=1 Tax=Actinoallomurus sp. CA-142502 TaxID=3239885 RepID=UPI003D8E4038